MSGIDHDGNLSLTYDVSVSHRGRVVLVLGTGGSAVTRFYEIAEAGIPGAEETKFLSWGYNVLVTLKGDSLLKMLKEHYPEEMEYAEKTIDPKETYVIDCYDMS